VEALLQLENDMAQAWVQRDAHTLVRILADDYTLGGTGDSLIKKEEYVAGLDNPEFRTTSAIVDELRIRVYDNAAVVTGRTVYRGWSKKGGTEEPPSRWPAMSVREQQALRSHQGRNYTKRGG